MNWVTGGSEKSSIYIKFLNCCYPHYLFDPYLSHSTPLSPSKAAKNSYAEYFVTPFHSQTWKTNFDYIFKFLFFRWFK